VNPAEKRLQQVKTLKDVALLFVLLVGAGLFVYLAVGFGLMLTEWFTHLPGLTP
jgi:hypothetical protein